MTEWRHCVNNGEKSSYMYCVVCHTIVGHTQEHYYSHVQLREHLRAVQMCFDKPGTYDQKGYYDQCVAPHFVSTAKEDVFLDFPLSPPFLEC